MRESKVAGVARQKGAFDYWDCPIFYANLAELLIFTMRVECNEG